MLLCFRHYCFCLVTKSCLTLCNPMNSSPQVPLSMAFPRRDYWRGFAISFFKGSSWPRDQTWVSCLAGGFFTTEPRGKYFRHYYPSELQEPSCFRLLHSLKKNTMGSWKNILKLAIANITTSYPLLCFSIRQITLFSKPVLTDLFYSFHHSFSFSLSFSSFLWIYLFFIFLSPLSQSPFLSHWMFCLHASFSGGSEQRKEENREWWIEVNHFPFLTGSSKTVLLLYIKYIINKDLLHSTGNSTQYSVMVCNGKRT